MAHRALGAALPALLVASACLFAGHQQEAARAQTPPATPNANAGLAATATALAGLPQGQRLTMFPFELVLSGPADAPAGGDIAYTLKYTRVLPPPGDSSVVFVYGSAQHASLVSITAIEGPEPFVEPMNPGLSETVGFHADAGMISLVVRPAGGFSGQIVVGLDVLGTQITVPPGSVISVQTNVDAGPSPVASATPQGSPITLPGTGSSPLDASSPGSPYQLWLVAALVLMGTASVLIAIGLVARRPRT